jgi:hypothetical protein
MWICKHNGIAGVRAGRGYEKHTENKGDVRLEVFTVVTMKYGVFWDVTPCGSCNSQRFGGT